MHRMLTENAEMEISFLNAEKIRKEKMQTK